MECRACGMKINTAKYVCAKCGKEEMREVKEGEEVKSCCGQVMIKKDEYIEKLSAQLKELSSQIDLLRNKAEKGTSEIKIAISKEVEILNKMMRDAQKNLQEMKGKTGDAWKVFTEGTNKAWNDLKEAVRLAGEKFK